MYTVETHPCIAIDFDGTIIEPGSYPDIGNELPGAIRAIKDLIDCGYEVNIWTCRGGPYEEEVVEYLHSKGLEVGSFGINEHFEAVKAIYPIQSAKIYANVYIDDQAHGVESIDWSIIRNLFKELRGVKDD